MINTLMTEKKEKLLYKLMSRHGYSHSNSVNNNYLYFKNIGREVTKMFYFEPGFMRINIVTIYFTDINRKLVITDISNYTCRQLLTKLLPHL